MGVTMLLVKLLGLWGWLKRAAVALWGLAVRYPWQTALIASLCLAGWLWRGKQEALAERDLALSSITQLEAASAENAKALAERDRKFTLKTKELADENEALQKRIDAAYTPAADRYAGRMRFDKVCVSNAPATAEGQVAEVSDRPGADAVILERADYDILIANTLRLKAVHEWGEGLKAAGVAE